MRGGFNDSGSILSRKCTAATKLYQSFGPIPSHPQLLMTARDNGPWDIRHCLCWPLIVLASLCGLSCRISCSIESPICLASIQIQAVITWP
jgi:hypothetical protein